MVYGDVRSSLSRNLSYNKRCKFIKALHKFFTSLVITATIIRHDVRYL